MEHTITNHKHFSNFTIIPNEILRDKNMTFAEKGLLSYLLSLPDNWDIRVSVIAETFGETERGILKLLRGLIEMGYCKRVAIRKDGRLAGQHYVITDVANDFSAPAKNEGAENSASQNFSPAENSAPLKNEGAERINTLFQEEDNIYINNNKKREAPASTTRERKCLFEESKFYDYELFRAQFTELEFADVDLYYYYNRLKNWAGANGKKKNDWILTARNWMMDDSDKGKLKKIKDVGAGLPPDAIKYLQDMAD